MTMAITLRHTLRVLEHESVRTMTAECGQDNTRGNNTRLDNSTWTPPPPHTAHTDSTTTLPASRMLGIVTYHGQDPAREPQTNTTRKHTRIQPHLCHCTTAPHRAQGNSAPRTWPSWGSSRTPSMSGSSSAKTVRNGTTPTWTPRVAPTSTSPGSRSKAPSFHGQTPCNCASMDAWKTGSSTCVSGTKRHYNSCTLPQHHRHERTTRHTSPPWHTSTQTQSPRSPAPASPAHGNDATKDRLHARAQSHPPQQPAAHALATKKPLK